MKTLRTGTHVSEYFTDTARRSLIAKAIGCMAITTIGSGCLNSRPHGTSPTIYGQGNFNWKGGATVKYHLAKPAIFVECLEWRTDSQRIAWRCSNGPGYIFDLEKGQYTASLPAPQSIVTAGALLWIPNTNILLLGGDTLGSPAFSTTAITIVDSETGEIIRRVSGLIPPHEDLDPSGLSTDGPLSTMANCAKNIFIDKNTGEVIVRPSGGLSGFEAFTQSSWNAKIEHIAKVPVGRSCDLRPNSSEAVFSGPNGKFVVADRKSGITVCTKYAHPADTWVVKYSPDGRTLITTMLWSGMGGSDTKDINIKDKDRHKIKSWSTADYSFINATDVEMQACNAIAFHPSGRFFAAAANNEVLLFDTISLCEVVRFPCPIEDMTAISFSPNGDWIAVSGTSGVVCLMSP